MSVRLLHRYAVPVTVALPIALAGLVASNGSLPNPFLPDDSMVSAVPATGPLGIQDRPGDDPLPEPNDLTGAHPVTYPVGTSAVRQTVAREEAPGPDTSDLALPARVLQAYRHAASTTRVSDAACRLSWPLLAGIGKVESGHAYGGEVDRHGDTLVPILGPVLDGAPGVAAIPDTDDGKWDTDETWDRAVGPMQFIPSSWVVHGEDGNRDGRRDPNNVGDAALASAGYLCTGDRDMTVEKQRRQAVYSYNHSWDYVDLVLAWADAYAGGTPVLTGSLAGFSDDPVRDRDGGGGSSGDPAPDGSGDVAIMPPPSAAPVAEPTASVDSGSSGAGASMPEPTPSSDPAQTAEPTPTQTAEPTPTQTTAEPTPDPCPSPTDTSSPDESSATPTDSATAEPTATPTDTATPDPSGTATPEPTASCP